MAAPTLRNLFIAGFVALQVALPVRYYACGERYDERFAWRMFSPERMVQCQVDFELDGRRVNPYRRYHNAWVNLARRGRPDVIDAMIRDLCEDGDELRLRLACGDDKLSSGGSNLCDWGRLP